jgi:DNA-binding MarR family transcriptional regulator
MTTKSKTEDFAINNRIFFRLFQLGNVLQTTSTSILGVTTVQWAVLGALSADKAADGISFGELAERLIVSRQNLDGVLSRLEREGYVERTTDLTDRRARLVKITAKGRKFWSSLEQGIDNFYQDATADFSLNEQITLAYLSSKLRANLLAMREKGGLEE